MSSFLIRKLIKQLKMLYFSVMKLAEQKRTRIQLYTKRLQKPWNGHGFMINLLGEISWGIGKYWPKFEDGIR